LILFRIILQTLDIIARPLDPVTKSYKGYANFVTMCGKKCTNFIFKKKNSNLGFLFVT